MQYTYQTIFNFISDSVMSKFLRFAHAKFTNRFSPECVGGIKIFTSNSNRAYDFTSNGMRKDGIYIDFTDDLHENKNCVYCSTLY